MSADAAAAATPGVPSFQATSISTSTAVVFARLDPILKRLLEGLTSLKASLSSLSIQDCDKEDGDNDRETSFVRLVKSITNELESLSRGMRLEAEFSKEKQQLHQQQQKQQRRLNHAKALCLLTKYITLPLTAVFHLPLRDIYNAPPTHNNGNSNDNNNNYTSKTDTKTHRGKQGNQHDRKLEIRRSYVYQVYRLAAVAIRTFIEETTITTTTVNRPRETNPSSVTHASTIQQHNLLQTNTWIEHLIALIHSMPTYTEINGTTTPSSPSVAAAISSSSSLDDGSDAFVEILGAARSLLLCFDDNRGDGTAKDGHKDPVTVLLVEAWHGTLSMRLVDCLTAFITSGDPNDPNRSKGFSPRVHGAALETLFSLLQVTAPSTATAMAMAAIEEEGSKSYASSLSASSAPAFWRAVFPGVFAALYHRIASRSKASSSSSSPSTTTFAKIQIQHLSLESLILLLRITLSSTTCSSPSDSGFSKNEEMKNNHDSAAPNVERNSNDDLLTRLTSMAVAANNNKTNVGKEDKDKKEKAPPYANHEHDKQQQQHQLFFDRVRKRVEGPLVFMLRQLSLSSSDAIRREVVVLCKVILFETRHCWGNSSDIAAVNSTATATATSSPPENLMEQIPLELCIGFQQDPDASVRASAREIIDTYIEMRHVDSMSLSPPSLHSPSLWMVPRIIELVQKLSALVHRGNNNISNIEIGVHNINIGISVGISTSSNTSTTTELRTELNLLAGYLQCLDTTSTTSSYGKKNDCGTHEATPKESRAIHASMCNAIVSSKHLRRGLIQLFDVDLDSLSGKNGSLVSMVIDHRGNSPIKLRYLDHPDSMQSARDSILRSLGKLLGPKYGAIFVDEVISDFMEASFQMPKANNNHSSNDIFVGWLHEWIGSIVVAQEVLMGSFSVMETTASTRTQRDQLDQRELLLIEKRENRRKRILLSLASSILPLIVDCSLWNLSIDNRIATMNTTATNNNSTTLSPQTLQRNQIVVVLLMEYIGVFCQLLRRDLNEVLVSILYPIVEKTTRRGSKTSSDIIQQIGLSTLKIISLSCGLQSTENLIHAEQNRLIAAMVGRLRLPGGSRIPKNRDDAEEILSVAKTSIWALEMINRRNTNTSAKSQQADQELELATNSAVVDLVALLDYRLDHLFLQKVLVDADVETVCSFQKAFFNYFLFLFEVKKEATYSFQMKNVEKDSKQPWLDLLSQFRKIPLDTQETDGGNDAKENVGRLLDVTKSDIALFAKLIGRGCYLLSYQKLESRISSCDALTIAFKFLAFVGSEHDDPTDDKNVIRNTILRQVADSWPSIRARLKSLSEVILNSNSNRKSSSIVLVLNQSNTKAAQRGTSKPPEDIGTQRIFLSKLFELIATMCECSGDFFADRFRNDVWPVMARHLEYLLEELQRQREAHTPSMTTGGLVSSSFVVDKKTSLRLFDNHQTTVSFKMSDTQRQLIGSILKCLNRIFQQQECGKAVETLLGSIGSTLLPLLDIEDQTKIQELSMDCIRNILRIDCDVLRRPLVDLSGTRIPSCPLKFGMDLGNNSGEEKADSSPDYYVSVSTGRSSSIANRCHELLAFADALPEQAIS